jgi:ornithine cyclodeaminase/alanine dehydrogenase-like protein (mu-crystallin family)
MTFTVLSDIDIQMLLHGLSSSDVTKLAENLNQALIQYSCHNELPYQPHRAVVKRPDGQVSLFMPATTPSSIGVKIVGVAPSESSPPGSKPKPALSSVLTICDAFGYAIGVLNAAELTAFRTALGSMLLYRFRKATKNIVVFGAGKQAEWHIRLAVLLKGQGIRKVTIVNRSSQRAKELVDSLSGSGVAPHVNFGVFDETEGRKGLADVVAEADIIFCTTPSIAPLFPASFLTSESARSKTCFIAAIGSYRLDMVEIDPELLQTITDPAGFFSSQVYQASVAVDSIKGCMDEAGELVNAGLKAEQMLEVGQIDKMRGDGGNRGLEKWLEEGLVVYKSVGVGVMDIAIGRALIKLAEIKGVGVHLDSF